MRWEYFFSNKIASNFVDRVRKLNESARRFVDNFLIGAAQLAPYVRTKLTRVRPVPSCKNHVRADGDAEQVQYVEGLLSGDPEDCLPILVRDSLVHSRHFPHPRSNLASATATKLIGTFA